MSGSNSVTWGSLDLFEAVLPDDGTFMAFELPAQRHRAFETKRALADHVERSTADAVYFACAAFRSADSRRADNVHALRAFWLDLDCGSDKAAEGKGYATEEVALRALRDFCGAVGLPRPIVVVSGGGLHVYWPLTADVAPAEWLPVAAALKKVCRQQGLMADHACTADAARILRPPGTLNRKYDPPRGVEVLSGAKANDLGHLRVTLLQASSLKPPVGAQLALGGLTVSPSEANRHGFTLLEVEDALRQLDPWCSRDRWAPVGMALADAYGEDARDLFLRWSRGDLWGGQ
jgi:hypothetical protein